jgi:hypothetical protein
MRAGGGCRARSAAMLGVDRSGGAPDERLGGNRFGDCRSPVVVGRCCSFCAARPPAPAQAAAVAERGGGTPSPSFSQNNLRRVLLWTQRLRFLPCEAGEGDRRRRWRGRKRHAPLAGFTGTPPAARGENQSACASCQGGPSPQVQRRGAEGKQECAEVRLPHRRVPRIPPRPRCLCADAQSRTGAAARATAASATAHLLRGGHAGALLRAHAAVRTRGEGLHPRECCRRSASQSGRLLPDRQPP